MTSSWFSGFSVRPKLSIILRPGSESAAAAQRGEIFFPSGFWGRRGGGAPEVGHLLHDRLGRRRGSGQRQPATHREYVVGKTLLGRGRQVGELAGAHAARGNDRRELPPAHPRL